MITKFLYLDIPAPLSCQTTLWKKQVLDGKYCVFPKQTVVHIKGGGQKDDVGYINGFPILQMSVDVGLVSLKVDKQVYDELDCESVVTLSVDSNIRKVHAIYHSGGHVLADVVQNLMGVSTQCIKTNHYPLEANLCFSTLPEFTVEQIQTQYDAYLDKIKNTIPYSQVDYSQFVNGKPMRTTVLGDYACHCGGTHVSDLRQLKGLKVSKIKRKKQHVNIHYLFPLD